MAGMTPPNAGAQSPADRSWADEQSHWAAYFETFLQGRLVWAKQYIAQSDRAPRKFLEHLDSLLALLQQYRLVPALHLPAVELIEQMHPWPYRWGYCRRWEREIRFAIKICARLGQRERHAGFLGFLAQILYDTGCFDEALEVAERAIALAEAAHAGRPLARGALVLVSVLLARGAIEEAQGMLTLVMDKPVMGATGSGRIESIAPLELQQADILRRQGKLQQALRQVDQVVASLEQPDDAIRHLLAQAYNDRSVVLFTLGEYAAAIADLDRARAIFDQAGDVSSAIFTLSHLGLLYWSMGDLRQAETTFLRTIELCTQYDIKRRLIQEIGNLGLVYLLQGKLEKALSALERQLALALLVHDVKETNRAIGNRGIARLYRGDYAGARADLETDLAFLQSQELQAYLGCTLTNLSWCYAALGEEEKALAYAEQAWQLAHQIGSIGAQIVALRCLSEYKAPPEKSKLLYDALGLARARRRFDEAACLLSLASIAEHESEQARLWREGCALLEEMDASQWVEGLSVPQSPRLPLIY